MKKERKGCSITPGERSHVDKSSIKGNSFGGAKFWAIIMDDFTSNCSYFLIRKDELADKLINLIKE